MLNVSQKTKERFNSRITHNPEGCWIWVGVIDRQGYAKYSNKRASRLAYELTYGEVVPPELSVLHTCDNPRCVNPDHLFLGTQKDNIQDAIAKGRVVPKDQLTASTRALASLYRMLAPFCKQGHYYYGVDSVYYRTDGSRRCKHCFQTAQTRQRAASAG